jgi:hypothetical protein
MGGLYLEKNDIMKGKRYGHYKMITIINCKETNKPHYNPHKILPFQSNITQKVS